MAVTGGSTIEAVFCGVTAEISKSLEAAWARVHRARVPLANSVRGNQASSFSQHAGLGLAATLDGFPNLRVGAIGIVALLDTVGARGAAAAEELAFGLPIDCAMGQTCFIQQFVDMAEGAASLDPYCGT